MTELLFIVFAGMGERATAHSGRSQATIVAQPRRNYPMHPHNKKD
ncbi:hypothetical protein [Halopseudomonas sabulinigri]|nr:hypothetical protein [Halopseudomonas sabulinigri]